MAETGGRPRTRLWERPAVGWRLAALALAVAPQILLSSIPPPKEKRFAILGPAFVEGNATAMVRTPEAIEGGTPEMFADCLGYLSRSGLVALALATALMLTGIAGRRGAFGALWALVLGAALAAFAATADGQGRLSAYCYFYALAAMSLAAGGMRAALTRTGPERSPG